MTEEVDTCPICLLEIGTTNVFISECGHKFCGTCILKNTQFNYQCPMCRNELISNEDRHTAFFDGFQEFITNHINYLRGRIYQRTQMSLFNEGQIRSELELFKTDILTKTRELLGLQQVPDSEVHDMIDTIMSNLDMETIMNTYNNTISDNLLNINSTNIEIVNDTN